MSDLGILILLLTILQLDIVQQEYIHQHGLNQVELVKAAFDSRGSWLATVEQREEKGGELELQMKLWAYDEQKQRCLSLCFHKNQQRAALVL